MQYPLYTVLVFDEHFNGIPVAWVMAKSETADTITAWLRSLVAKARAVNPNFRPLCVIVDDCQAEMNATWCVQGGSAACLQSRTTQPAF